MSISSEIRRAGPFAGNGSTVNFPFTFKVFTTAQVVVTRTVSGADTTLTLTTDYTVALNSDQDTSPGGTVTMLTAPATGQSITITSNVANLQPTVLANLGGFYPEVINDSLDRATIQIQQLDERVDRALVLPVSSSGVSTQLPAPEAGKLLGWNSSANGVVSYAATTVLPPNAATIDALSYSAGDYIEATGASTFRARKLAAATYAALTAIAAASRHDDMLVYVASRATDGDGGEGWWRFDASSSATANGGTILAPDAGTGRWLKIRKPVVDPREFGAAGNGSTNDATALQAALTASSGGILDLMGLTYRCDSALTGVSNVTVRNGTIDYSQGLASSAIGIAFEGTLGSADTSLGAVAYLDRSLTVTSNTGYSINDELLILTEDIWSTDSSELRGQWVKVKSKTSTTTLNLYGSSYDVYSTGRKIYKPTLVQNIHFEDVTFVGGGVGDGQFGIRFRYAKNVSFRNCRFRDWAYSAVEFYASLDISVTACEAAHGDDSIGASYGFAFYDCCERFSVTDGRGEDLRHFVTIGGTNGVSRFGTVKGVVCRAMTDSFLDAHPAAEFVAFVGNVGEHETAFDGDGIVYQGANGTITGNQIIAANTAGILVQPFAYHNRDCFVISDNIINRIESASGYGILVDVRTPVRAMTISGNIVLSAVNQGINIQSNGGDLFGLVINGNSITASVAEALYVQAVTTGFIQRVSVTGNVFHRANTSGPVVDFFAGTEAYGQYVAFTGNTIINGTYSIRCDAEWERVLIVGNVLRDFATAATELTGVGVTVNANNLTT